MDKFFKYKNMNPWGKKLNDCAIRAVSAALQLKYDAVCQIFNRKCKINHGLVDRSGISLALVKHKLNKFFDIIEDADDVAWDKRPAEFEDLEFDPLIDADPDLGMTLSEFCMMYNGTGRYLVSLVHEDRIKNHGVNVGHIVYVNLKPGAGWFYDTWDCSSMVVEAFMRIRYIVDRDDPRSLLFKHNSI